MYRTGLLITSLLVGTMVASPAMANSKYASIVVDGKTGKVLHKDNADAPRYPASLTKVMTLYVLFDYLTKNKLNRNTKFYVTPYAARRPPTRMGLRSGRYVKVRDLIGSLITKSANDGATVVAENLAGTEANFARLMTLTARRLGMKNTIYKNASGLPNALQKTTARDQAILAARIYKDFPRLSRAFKTKYYKYGRKQFRNHNRLLFNYAGTEGVKTGYTRASGFNLTSSVRKGNRHVIAVVMGGRTGARRNRHMRSLLNKHFRKARPIKGRIIPRVFAGRSMRNHKVRVARYRPIVPKRNRALPARVGTQQRNVRKAVNRTTKAVAPVNAAYKGRFQRPPLSQYLRDYDLQIGSFTSESEANKRIADLRKKAKDILGSHKPFTMQFKKGDTLYYRARFADFSRKSARKTCSRLKKRGFSCLAMRAN